jgi:hypothetical protein
VLRGLVNLNVHFLVVPDAAFVTDGDHLGLATHPPPSSADVLAVREQLAQSRARRQVPELPARDGEHALRLLRWFCGWVELVIMK